MRRIAVCLLLVSAIAVTLRLATAGEPSNIYVMPGATVVNTVAAPSCPACPNCGPGCCRRCLGCLGGCGGAGSQFNCQCRGSYKYPVPPQDTYFWPGIFSQKTMTQYVSPLRNPPLNPWRPTDPPEEKKEAKESAQLNRAPSVIPREKFAASTGEKLILPVAGPESRYVSVPKGVQFSFTCLPDPATGGFHFEMTSTKPSAPAEAPDATAAGER